uniref:Uncharacterized protein n=1 Tax=Anopheles funestus TaxID=62324 RepID=A0A4Y0BNR8_ANOFN
MIAKRSLPLLLISTIWCFKTSWCDTAKERFSKASYIPQPETSWDQSTAGLDPSFYVTTDFILRLNELIKHLALYSLDNTLDTREAIDRAGTMWNQTEAVLEDLVTHSQANTDNLHNGNLTNLSLRTALEAVRLEKRHFLKEMADYNRRMEIETISLIDRTKQENDVVMADPGMTFIMHSSVHGLTSVTVGLLHSLEGMDLTRNGGAQARANPTRLSIETFLAVFQRTIVDTKLNFQTQANRVLRRVRAQLSTLSLTPELGQYFKDYSALIATFKMNVHALLEATYQSVVMSMDSYRTRIDEEVSLGISELLSSAGQSAQHAFLYLCFKRYVYTYYDQSLAVAKLLYCGEPELRTLEYLVKVAEPILERAAISDSSAVQMSVICATGSAACMANYYTSLRDQFLAAESRFQSYAHFIDQELMALSHRVDVCALSTVLDIEYYVQMIKTKFQTCLTTGSVN